MFKQHLEHLSSIKMNIEQIKQKINELEIDGLAKSSGFQKRKPKKIDLLGFLGGFWLMILSKEHSLSSWVRNISRLQACLISKQALDKRLRKENNLGKKILDYVLKHPLNKALQESRHSDLFRTFTNVYIEDSSCISLAPTLASIFPGPHNRYGKSATARIQLRLNLLSDLYSNIALSAYRNNDQKYAKEILLVLQAGDLAIRDLGYWSLSVFRKISSKGAFFLSRYRYGTHIFDEQEKQIELAKYLTKSYKKGQSIVDKSVLVGKTEKLPVRLVAIRAPQQVILKRRRAAEKNRDRRLNHSQEYYTLLEWTIFITNIEASTWSYKELLAAYRCRWRIEMVFKCWKSKFNFGQLFKIHKRINPNRAIMTIYLLLAMLTLFYARWYYYFIKAVYTQTGKHVSPFKFADFVKEHFWDLFLKPKKWMEFVPLVAYYHTYEKRKRINHLHFIFNPLG